MIQAEVDRRTDMASNSTVFSTTLSTLRKKQGVTQEQLANHLGVSAQAVSKWENGSYPEGDLLPKISEFFGVSISYLYGQEKESVSVEQTVLEEMLKISGADMGGDSFSLSNRSEQYFNRIFDILWSFQIGAWTNNKTYYDRGIPEKGSRTASAVTSDAGFTYFNLNREKQFFCAVREPDEGFSEIIRPTAKMKDFFMLLGKDGALNLMIYLLSLNWGEYVTIEKISQNIGVSEAETKSLLDEFERIREQGNPPLYVIDVINGEKSEKAYGVNQPVVPLFIAMYLAAENFIRPPYGFQMQVGNRGKSWLDRKKVEQNFKEDKKNGKNI